MKTPLPPEFDAMAQRFIELWQDQWMQFAGNKDTAAAMQKLTELMVPPANINQFFKQGGHHDSTAPLKQAAAAGAKTTAASLDALADQLAQLARRVDALSEQLGAGAQPRTAKPRAKPAAGKARTAGRSAGKKRRR